MVEVGLIFSFLFGDINVVKFCLDNFLICEDLIFWKVFLDFCKLLLEVIIEKVKIVWDF